MLALVVLIISLIFATKLAENDIEITIIEENKLEEVDLYCYHISEKNDFVSLPLLLDDCILQIISYYTINQNMLPLNYFSPISSNASVTDVNIQGTEVTLTFDRFYLLSDQEEASNCLKKSLNKLGYTQVFIIVSMV